MQSIYHTNVLLVLYWYMIRNIAVIFAVAFELYQKRLMSWHKKVKTFP